MLSITKEDKIDFNKYTKKLALEIKNKISNFEWYLLILYAMFKTKKKSASNDCEKKNKSL